MPNRAQIEEADRRQRGWSEKVVSWGHMMIAMGAVVVSFGTYTISNERANEKRLVQLEERYYSLAERDKEQSINMGNALQARNAQITNIERKLDLIAADVVALKVQSATMQQQLQRGRY